MRRILPGPAWTPAGTSPARRDGGEEPCSGHGSDTQPGVVGKTMGNPWENYGKTMGKWDFSDLFRETRINLGKATENLLNRENLRIAQSRWNLRNWMIDHGSSSLFPFELKGIFMYFQPHPDGWWWRIMDDGWWQMLRWLFLDRVAATRVWIRCWWFWYTVKQQRPETSHKIWDSKVGEHIDCWWDTIPQRARTGESDGGIADFISPVQHPPSQRSRGFLLIFHDQD